MVRHFKSVGASVIIYLSTSIKKITRKQVHGWHQHDHSDQRPRLEERPASPRNYLHQYCVPISQINTYSFETTLSFIKISVISGTYELIFYPSHLWIEELIYQIAELSQQTCLRVRRGRVVRTISL